MSSNFTNINNSAEVSALLEQLRASKAWAELQAQPAGDDVHNSEGSAATQSSDCAELPRRETAGPSVANLLSELSSSGRLASPAIDGPTSTGNSATLAVPDPRPELRQTRSRTVIRPETDLRKLSFHQSLAHLAQLSDDAALVDDIAKLRQEQRDLERQLWKEREAVYSRQVEKVEIAVTKAKMLGTGISEREANAMKQGFEKELRQFDRGRVIPAWEGLVARQQAGLEKLGVPTMFVTDVHAGRERQRKVMQVVEGIVNGDELY